MNHNTKTLLIALLCSINIHLALLIPAEYVSNPKKMATPSGTRIDLKLQTKSVHPTGQKAVFREKQQEKADGFTGGDQDYYSNITVPDEITDVPAKLKNTIEFDAEISEKVKSVQLKIWVSRQGFVDKVELLDEIEEPYAEKIKAQMMLQEFEPAIYKGKPVNSLLMGEIYMIK